jgi:hypothetical protein
MLQLLYLPFLAFKIYYVMKINAMGEGGRSKIVQICVTLFMDAQKNEQISLEGIS